MATGVRVDGIDGRMLDGVGGNDGAPDVEYRELIVVGDMLQNSKIANIDYKNYFGKISYAEKLAYRRYLPFVGRCDGIPFGLIKSNGDCRELDEFRRRRYNDAG